MWIVYLILIPIAIIAFAGITYNLSAPKDVSKKTKAKPTKTDISVRVEPVMIKPKARPVPKIADHTINSYMGKNLIRFPFYIQEKQTFYLLNNEEDVKTYSDLMNRKIVLIDSMNGCVLFIVGGTV
jgi:hypothetical protein|nr:MAG TPA: hypothetical protein [Caudoviricetes sp.]